MRSTLFIALGSVAAFAASLAGTYILMPMVAPDLVEAERSHADSLATLLVPDSLAVDSLISALPSDSLALAEPSVALPDGVVVLSDSIATLLQQLAAYETQISALQTEVGATKAQRTQARELAATLIKLEDRELASVLARLDLDVLTLLYTEASARNRTRLLGALDPSRTALFVRRVASAPAQANVPS